MKNALISLPLFLAILIFGHNAKASGSENSTKVKGISLHDVVSSIDKMKGGYEISFDQSAAAYELKKSNADVQEILKSLKDSMQKHHRVNFTVDPTAMEILGVQR